MPRIEKEIEVISAQGLHARPAAIFVQKASKYDSVITVIKDGESVNGKSIMGILMLGAHKGSRIVIVTEGDDAQEAMFELQEFLTKNE